MKLIFSCISLETEVIEGLPCGPVVKNLPCSSRDAASIPGWERGPTSLRATKPARQLLNPRTTTWESMCRNQRLSDATKIPCAATETWGCQIKEIEVVYDTGPTLIQKAQINYMSRYPDSHGISFYSFTCLYSKGSKGRRRKRTASTSGRLCTSKTSRQPEVDVCSGQAQRLAPLKRWWRKTAPCGQSLGNTKAFICVEERRVKVPVYMTLSTSEWLAICRDLKKNTSGNMTWWSGRGLWMASFFLSIRQQPSHGGFFVGVLLN